MANQLTTYVQAAAVVAVLSNADVDHSWSRVARNYDAITTAQQSSDSCRLCTAELRRHLHTRARLAWVDVVVDAVPLFLARRYQPCNNIHSYRMSSSRAQNCQTQEKSPSCMRPLCAAQMAARTCRLRHKRQVLGNCMRTPNYPRS